MWDAIRNPVSERWRGRGKPPHFDRLRWWMGWHGGSRGKVRRMRAGPVVPVGLAWRWGRNSRHKLAGITQRNWFSWHEKIAREERFWLCGKAQRWSAYSVVASNAYMGDGKRIKGNP